MVFFCECGMSDWCMKNRSMCDEKFCFNCKSIKLCKSLTLSWSRVDAYFALHYIENSTDMMTITNMFIATVICPDVNIDFKPKFVRVHFAVNFIFYFFCCLVMFFFPNLCIKPDM